MSDEQPIYRSAAKRVDHSQVAGDLGAPAPESGDREKRAYRDGYRKLQPVDASRRVAFDVIRQVNGDGAYANIALAKALRNARREHRGFDGRDAAFTTELVSGTLRQQGRLDFFLARHLSRPIEQIDPPVLDVMRLGAHQLLDMRVPDHAAVAQTVDLAREVLTAGPVGMVNAVLRALTRETEQERDQAVAAIEDDTARLAVEHSHPEWIVTAFADALAANGCDRDELPELLAADNERPYVSLIARPGLLTRDELADEAEDILRTRVAFGEVSPYSVILESGDPSRLPSIRNMHAGAQDEGSQLAALVAASAPIDDGPDARWLDLCAGPGGKAALLAALGAESGARLTANEVHSHRARLVARALEPFDNTEVVSGDGREFGGPGTEWPLASFDRVVVDAPCTGLGSLRRRPESRWRRSIDDLKDLVELQQGLLDRALQLTRPGGVLTYITCSPHVAETHQQVARLLGNGGVELLDARAIARAESPSSIENPGEGLLQLWEHRNGTDLMFVATLRRTLP